MARPDVIPYLDVFTQVLSSSTAPIGDADILFIGRVPATDCIA
jgi:hypothetical protein